MEDLRNQAVGSTIAKWDEHNSNECGDRVADVLPVHVHDLADHHAADLTVY